METVILYRPTGPRELKLVKESGYKRWPPRLPDQPIFYPVTNEQYAREIASTWNVNDSGCGFVCMFEIKKDFISRYSVQQVGGSVHTEYWIPAEDLEEMNNNILGTIEVIAQYPSGALAQI